MPPGHRPLTDLIETHRSFVNTWECDENDHLNVQFYLRHFDIAARFFDAVSAGAGHEGPLPRTRHVRYRAELRAGATVRVRSAEILDGPAAGHVAHFLEDAVTGALSATALDSPTGARHRDGVTELRAAEAMPRGIGLAPETPLSAGAIAGLGGLAASRAIVGWDWCGKDGTMREQFHVTMMSDAAAQVWNTAGVGQDWLEANGYGRVAVEMKLTHHTPARVGDALVLQAALTALEGKTVHLRHEIARLDGAPVATGLVVALLLDHRTRRSVPMPDFVRQRMEREAAARDPA